MSEQEARDPATRAELLEELSNDPALRIFVASNPAAPAKLLKTLATDLDPQVRTAVTSNPNTPWPTLEHLAWEFPHAFLNNPAGPLQMIAHPEQISTTNDFWAAQLREGSIPSWWWHWLTSHPRLRQLPYHYLAVSFLPSVELQKLAASPRWDIRFLVASNAQTPGEVRQQLSQDGNRYVRAMAQASIAQRAKEGTD